MARIPQVWLEEIERNTEFGKRAARAISKLPKITTSPPIAPVYLSQIGNNLHAIIQRETGNSVPCSECKREIDKLNMMTVEEVLLETIPLSDRIVARSAKNAQRWYQRVASKYLPGMVAAKVREWIVEACGVNMVAPKKPSTSEVVAGTIHEGNTFILQAWAKATGVPVKLGNLSPDFCRRILTVSEHENTVRTEVQRLNGGTDRLNTSVPWVAGRWSYSITTVPSRIDTLITTLESLESAGFDDPVISVDGPNDGAFDSLQGYTYRYRGENIRSYAHWYLTLQEMFLRDPWCQYYAIFQDDFVCVRNLRAYLTKCTYPEKGYWNLFTFMENDDMVQQTKAKGWVPAARAAQGYQLGRGAVALVFSHEAVQVLLNSPHMKVRVYDSQKGYKSIDGGVVTAMHQAGWTEYVHSPSLTQHIGEVSSMGNRKHPISKCFDSEFDPMS